MNRLRIVAILLISALSVYAEDQQPNVAKLKADEEQDRKKAEALSQQITELEKKLGPEYLALVNDLKNVDPNSSQGQEIDSILAPLDEPCPD